MLWAPSLRFLRSGSCDIPDIGLVTWSFRDLGSLLLPFKYLECRMKVGEIEALGYGEGLWVSNAMTKALAEAWERFWMIRLSRQQSDKKVSSNGFAAGPDISTAIQRAVSELIERQWVLAAWYSMRGFNRTSSDSLIGRISKLIFRAEGWNLDFYTIEAHQKRVLVGLARSAKEGAVFDAITYVSKSDYLKLSRSLLRAIVVARSLCSPDKPYELPDWGRPADHLKFYRSPERLKAFEFMENSGRISEDLFSCEGIQTSCLYDGGLLPPVARAVNPEWYTLTWGGSSVQGLNAWPHPIA